MAINSSENCRCYISSIQLFAKEMHIQTEVRCYFRFAAASFIIKIASIACAPFCIFFACFNKLIYCNYVSFSSLKKKNFASLSNNRRVTCDIIGIRVYCGLLKDNYLIARVFFCFVFFNVLKCGKPKNMPPCSQTA